MEDLAGLLFLFGAIVVASVAIVVEAAVPPSRPAIGRYLALHAVLLLYATVVFGQYLVSRLNGSVAVVSVLRSMEYALAPLSAIVVAWWARVVVSTDRLHVSYGTVKTHVYRIYRKLGVGSKTALVRALEPPVPQGNEPRANGVSAD